MGRKYNRARCQGCGLHTDLCACAELPCVAIQTPLCIVQHVGERYKPTNTGRLLHKMVSTSSLIPFGERDAPFELDRMLDRDLEYVVLYPREDAEVLEEGAGDGRGFVLLDGTWHQCSRMTRRAPVVRELRCVALPDGPPSLWSVRTQHDERGLCTLEAGIRLVELIAGPHAAAPLQAAFETITARMLYMKGKLPSPEVPAGWRDRGRGTA